MREREREAVSESGCTPFHAGTALFDSLLTRRR